jgi:predicted DsbA family dithiol-disulfide isomerase
MTTRINIDIVSDAVCPWCFIGKRRLEAALDQAQGEFEVYVGWRPFQLNPEMPAGGADRKTYLAAKFGGAERADGMYRSVREAGATAGIDFRFEDIQRTPNTVDAHRLIGIAGRAGVQDAVVESLFRAYFLEGRDIGDHKVLAEIAAAAGLDPKTVGAYLAGTDDVDRVQKEDETARRMGIQGVPCFIFNRKYAVSGAQEPEVLLQVMRRVKEELAKEPAPAAAGE